MPRISLENLKMGIDNLRNTGSPNMSIQGRNNDPEVGELDKFANDQVNNGQIFKVTRDEVIDCDKYNYYYESLEQVNQYKGYVAKKISSKSDVNTNRNNKYINVYRVERLDRPTMEKMMTGFKGLFKSGEKGNQTAEEAPVETQSNATGETPTAGGRKSRRSRKSKKQRKSRKSRRSRR